MSRKQLKLIKKMMTQHYSHNQMTIHIYMYYILLLTSFVSLKSTSGYSLSDQKRNTY